LLLEPPLNLQNVRHFLNFTYTLTLIIGRSGSDSNPIFIEPLTYILFGDMLEDSIRSKGYRDVIAKGRAQGLVVIGLTLDETGAPLKRDMRSSLVLQMMEMDPAEEPTNSIS
jgi:hypothetical protein